MGQHGIVQVGKGSIEAGVIMVLQEFSLQPGISKGFVVAQQTDSRVNFSSSNGGSS